MENKKFYEAPSTEVIEVAQRGVMCASSLGSKDSPYYNMFNDEEDW